MWGWGWGRRGDCSVGGRGLRHRHILRKRGSFYDRVLHLLRGAQTLNAIDPSQAPEWQQAIFRVLKSRVVRPVVDLPDAGTSLVLHCPPADTVIHDIFIL